ncbi:hypothetical protein DVH24_034646 [Malus domestica]|uniref:Uncharacterized protein n=1 Tax=Malus domestica TaxID=3750 RepID=A0A498IX36_MALDO|nr:hypothetical protein DVH24_034646 [Malus domestica]
MKGEKKMRIERKRNQEHFCQDVVRLTFIALTNEKVITLCERFAGQEANITTVPVSVLRITRQLPRLFEWPNDVADGLAFPEVSS